MFLKKLDTTHKDGEGHKIRFWKHVPGQTVSTARLYGTGLPTSCPHLYQGTGYKQETHLVQ